MNPFARYTPSQSANVALDVLASGFNALLSTIEGSCPNTPDKIVAVAKLRECFNWCQDAIVTADRPTDTDPCCRSTSPCNGEERCAA